MDKLKQNIYWIAVGAVALVLIALMVFLVFLPLGELQKARDELQATSEKLGKAAKRDQDPKNPKQKIVTKDYKAELSRRKDALDAAKAAGVERYVQASRRFKLFFEDGEAAPPSADFSARYKDALDNLIKGYRDKFKITKPAVADDKEKKDDEGGADNLPPKVGRVPEPLEDAMIPLAMQEYWMIEEVFKVCDKLGLGGLQLVDFPGRTSATKESYEYQAYTEAQVQLLMAPNRVEDFVSELFASDRVLFEIVELSYHRMPASVTSLAHLELAKQYKDALTAQKEDFKDVVQEPPVVVDLKLRAFDFKGEPAEKEEPKKDGKTPPKA